MSTAYIPRYRRALIANMIASGTLVRTKKVGSGRKSFWNNLVAAMTDDGLVSGGGSGSYYPIPQAQKDPDIIIGTDAPAWYQEPAPLVDPNAPAPQTQYMDMDEFRAISEEGIVIPPGSSVVVIPVSQYDDPVLYDTVVKAAEANPGSPIADVVSSVLNPDINPVYNVILPEVPVNVISDVVKTDVLYNQHIVEIKEQYPDAPLTRIEQAIEEGNFTPVLVADPAIINEQPTAVVSPPILPGPPNSIISGLVKGTKNIPGTMAKDEEEMYVSGAVAAAGIIVLLLL